MTDVCMTDVSVKSTFDIVGQWVYGSVPPFSHEEGVLASQPGQYPCMICHSCHDDQQDRRGNHMTLLHTEVQNIASGPPAVIQRA